MKELSENGRVRIFDSLESIGQRHSEKLREMEEQYILSLHDRKKELEEILHTAISDNQKQLIFQQIKDIEHDIEVKSHSAA